MDNIDRIRLEEIHAEFPTTEILYIPDFMNQNNGIGCFLIGKPKDPKEPYND